MQEMMLTNSSEVFFSLLFSSSVGVCVCEREREREREHCQIFTWCMIMKCKPLNQSEMSNLKLVMHFLFV